jgi:hypothetical protein
MGVCFLQSVVTLFCHHFCSCDFVSSKVDSSIVLCRSCLSKHEPNFCLAEFILKLVGLRDVTSVFVPHASFFSRDYVDETLISYCDSMCIVLRVRQINNNNKAFSRLQLQARVACMTFTYCSETFI